MDSVRIYVVLRQLRSPVPPEHTAKGWRSWTHRAVLTIESFQFSKYWRPNQSMIAKKPWARGFGFANLERQVLPKRAGTCLVAWYYFSLDRLLSINRAAGIRTGSIRSLVGTG